MTFEQDLLTKLMNEACPRLVVRPSPISVGKPTLDVRGPSGRREAFVWLEDDVVVVESVYGVLGSVPSVRLSLGGPGLYEDLRGVFTCLR